MIETWTPATGDRLKIPGSMNPQYGLNQQKQNRKNGDKIGLGECEMQYIVEIEEFAEIPRYSVTFHFVDGKEVERTCHTDLELAQLVGTVIADEAVQRFNKGR